MIDQIVKGTAVETLAATLDSFLTGQSKPPRYLVVMWADEDEQVCTARTSGTDPLAQVGILSTTEQLLGQEIRRSSRC